MITAQCLDDSVGVVITNFEGSSNFQSKAQTKAITSTINTLNDCKFDCGAAQCRLALCNKVSNLAEEGK